MAAFLDTKGLGEEVNLVDLKDDNHEDEMAFVMAHAKSDNDIDDSILDFSKLKLIENPIEEMSGNALPQTLKDCEGFLKALPLLQPNADQSQPETIATAVNSVLPLPSTKEGSDMDISLPTRKKTIHRSAPGFFGHTVLPGCISFYRKYGIVYAVPEGKWWLLDTQAAWVQKNRSLDTDIIATDDNQILILRIIEGSVGLITIQGVHYLLDVGTHVFNTGTVKVWIMAI